MKGKIGLVVGLGVGYVLGTRAGHERYEQIKTQWLKVWHLDPVQEQALVQAVMQQSRFDPNAGHFDSLEDDEDTTGICPHCINPPAPPLRDYYMWRTGQP